MKGKKDSKAPPKPIHQFQDFIEVSLSIGNSVEDIANKIGRSYKETLKYLNDNDLLNKYHRRSWTHKSEKKKHKRTKKDPDRKKGTLNWPPKCTMYISLLNNYGTPMIREFVAGRLF